jgi:hypothetical protein
VNPFAELKEMARVLFTPLFVVLQDIVDRRNADQSRCVEYRWLGYELRKDFQSRPIRQLKH